MRLCSNLPVSSGMPGFKLFGLIHVVSALIHDFREILQTAAVVRRGELNALPWRARLNSLNAECIELCPRLFQFPNPRSGVSVESRWPRSVSFARCWSSLSRRCNIRNFSHSGTRSFPPRIRCSASLADRRLRVRNWFFSRLIRRRTNSIISALMRLRHHRAFASCRRVSRGRGPFTR